MRTVLRRARSKYPGKITMKMREQSIKKQKNIIKSTNNYPKVKIIKENIISIKKNIGPLPDFLTFEDFYAETKKLLVAN